MGFGSIVTQVLLTFIVIVVVSVFTTTLYTQTAKLDDAYRDQQELYEYRNNNYFFINGTDYQFFSFSFFLAARIEMQGTQPVNLSHFDVYVNGYRVPRDEEFRIIQYSNQVKNPNLLDQGEHAILSFPITLDPGRHSITIVSPEGLVATEAFETT